MIRISKFTRKLNCVTNDKRAFPKSVYFQVLKSLEVGSPAGCRFTASQRHTQLFAHSVKTDLGLLIMFPLPAGTMLSVFSRGH